MLGRKTNPNAGVAEVQRGFDAYDLQMGDIMRGERATMGKSLLDVQRELKIKATYVAAVENADPSVFESPGFIAGYVRSYARYLGLDPEWAFERFCAESGFAGVEGLSGTTAARAKSGKPMPKLQAFGDDAILKPLAPYIPNGERVWDRIEPGAIGSVAVLLALIGALGYGGWTVLQEVQRVQFAPVEQSPGLTSNVDSIATEATIGDGFGSLNIAATDVSPSAPNVLDRLYRPQALEAPVLVARDGPIAAINPSEIGALAGAIEEDVLIASNTEIVTADPAAEEPISDVQVFAQASDEVVLVAVRPTWVQVTVEGGAVLLSKVLDKGESFTVPSEGNATVRTGNAGGLYFMAAGRTFGPSGGNGTVVKDIALDVAAIETRYPQADLEEDPELVEVLVALAEERQAVELLTDAN
ncbi:MAG: RodZ domain-containing protein [Litoreibacter sp.]